MTGMLATLSVVPDTANCTDPRPRSAAAAEMALLDAWLRNREVNGHDRPHRPGQSSAAFSPDGKRMVTAADDQTPKVWDAERGAETVATVSPVIPARVPCAAFSPDGKRVVTASAGPDGAGLGPGGAKAGRDLARRVIPVPCPCAAFSPDGKRVVTASC